MEALRTIMAWFWIGTLYAGIIIMIAGGAMLGCAGQIPKIEGEIKIEFSDKEEGGDLQPLSAVKKE